MKARFSKFTLFSALVLSMSASAKVVSVDNAEIAARNFLVSRGMPHEDLALLKTTDDSAVMRAHSKDIISPAFHIFSDKDKNEIIVVSGDDIARPILGYSFNYNADENGEIPPAMQDWLSEMERQISQARKAGVVQSTETARQWRAPAVGNVVKQLNTAKWGQGLPFNLECPIYNGERCITGCVATSYAILMKYYGSPTGATGTTPAYYSPKVGIAVPSRNLTATYDWNSMLDDYSKGFDYDQAIAVAKLMADIGSAIKADYSPQETSARYEGGYIFKHFGYYLGTKSYRSNYSVQEWNAKMKEQIDNNRPVLYNAQIEDRSAAHSFIIDGYTDQDYYIVNWGWAGSCDGAYALDAMIPHDDPYYTFTGPQSAYFDFKSALGVPTVAKLNGSIECPSLEAALAVAPDGVNPINISIVDKCAVDEVRIMKNQNVVLDLNGSEVDLMNYGLYNYGDLTITDSKGSGSMVFKSGNMEILSNFGNLTIQGGVFDNQVEIKEGENEFYRRCIWSEKGSSTYIKGGRFRSVSGVICTNGSLRIDGGEFNCLGNEAVIANYNLEDTVVINGGTFQNMTFADAGTNYRRTIWSCDGSVTHITGGVFNCKNPVVISNGDFIIDNGRFECSGNIYTIYNNSKKGKMTINGGVFINSLGIKEPSDYRIALYSVAGSNTEINGGQFSSANFVIATVGNLIINDATIENTSDGTGVSSSGDGKVTINYCKIKANRVLYNSNAELKCYGGLYSKLVADSFLGTGCKCVTNDDKTTSSVYRYKVVNPAGIDNISIATDAREQHYDLNGMVIPDNNPGIHIIRTSDGRTLKVLYK